MTANIRELLESAARALGLEYVEYTSYDEIDDVYSTCCWVRAAEGKLISWNPAEDDGDCARMEAALELSVSWEPKSVIVETGDAWAEEALSDHNNVKQAARRMASLRVAAEIGKRM